MDKIIWYEFDKFSEFQTIEINSYDLSISKIDYHNHILFLDKIQISIDKFNSQIKWDGMWDISEAKKRLHKNDSLYLLSKMDLPIGHVWYTGEYLYNAFVSNERNHGESQWFIQQTMLDRYKSGYNQILLYTEEFNQRAINFWEKLRFNRVEKNTLPPTS